MDSCDLGYVYRTELPDGRVLKLPYRIALKHTAYPSVCIFHDEEPVAAAPGSHLCSMCAEGFNNSVADIAECWPDLEEAMMPSGSAASAEPVSGTGDLYPPLPINPDVVEVRDRARRIIWSIVGQLVQDLPDRSMPADQSAGMLASWIANWHSGYLVTHPSAGHLRAVATELAAVAWEVRGVIYRSKPIEVTLSDRCHQLVAGPDKKTKLPCLGSVIAVQMPDGKKIVRCGVDITHRVPADQWFYTHANRRPGRAASTLMKKYMKVGQQ